MSDFNHVPLNKLNCLNLAIGDFKNNVFSKNRDFSYLSDFSIQGTTDITWESNLGQDLLLDFPAPTSAEFLFQEQTLWSS